MENPNIKELYLAGGCFWGTEKYLASVQGIVKTEVGYANGKTENPTYKEVCHNNTGHVEAVRIIYNAEQISLEFILNLYYKAIDPTSLNKQGGDVGTQYRTGIYYVVREDEEIIAASIKALQAKYKEPIQIEVKSLENFYTAEEYHQKYLDKNPGGYCHLPNELFRMAAAAVDKSKFNTQDEEEKWTKD